MVTVKLKSGNSLYTRLHNMPVKDTIFFKFVYMSVHVRLKLTDDKLVVYWINCFLSSFSLQVRETNSKVIP